jgi:AcrR family transcriptional regulator
MAKQARALRTYDRVLDAAAAEFSQHGYPRTNLETVVARTGLTKGALYGHFASKQQLAAALTEHLETVTDTLITHHRTADPTTTPLAQLVTLNCTLAERIQSDIRLRAALRLTTEQAQATHAPSHFLDTLEQATRHLIHQARHQGQLDPGLPTQPLADLSLAVLLGAYHSTPDPDFTDLHRRVRGMWDVLIPALKRRANP